MSRGWSGTGAAGFPFGGVVGLVGRRKNLRYRITVSQSSVPQFQLRKCRKLGFLEKSVGYGCSDSGELFAAFSF